MKIYEIIQESELVKAVATPLGKHTTLTGIEKGAHAAHDIDATTQSALMAVPGLVNAIANFSTNKTTASVEALKAFLPFLKNAPKSFDAISDMLGNSSIAAEFVHLIGKAAGGASGAGAMASAMTPMALLTAPAIAAGQEKAKIDANPNAPEYATNPYAMTVRGEAPTIAAAGNQNRRATVKNFSTAGNPAIPQQ
jgi:hypothetical protein